MNNNTVIDFIEKHKNAHFFLKVPNTFDEYFKQISNVTRTDYRKAIKNNFKFECITKLNEKNHEDIIKIWKSKEKRQNRDINYNYELPDGIKFNLFKENRWAINDYSFFNNINFFVVKNSKDNIVAYNEFYVNKNEGLVHSTLGHGEYLKFGVMKFLFLEIIKIKIGEINKIFYGIKPNTNFFLKDLLFINEK